MTYNIKITVLKSDVDEKRKLDRQDFIELFKKLIIMNMKKEQPINGLSWILCE